MGHQPKPFHQEIDADSLAATDRTSELSDHPWRFDPAPTWPTSGDGARAGWIVPHGSRVDDDPNVAYVENVGGADLAVMLAAPELLAACEALLAAVYCGEGPTESDDPEIVAAYHRATAALRKARGI